MRQTNDQHRRREQFMSDTLRLALEDDGTEVTVTPAGTPHGANLASAVVDGVPFDGRAMGQVFGLLYEDRKANRLSTQLDGVSTAWRDNMLSIRSVSDVTLLSGDDARRLLRLGLNQKKEVPA